MKNAKKHAQLFLEALGIDLFTPRHLDLIAEFIEAKRTDVEQLLNQLGSWDEMDLKKAQLFLATLYNGPASPKQAFGEVFGLNVDWKQNLLLQHLNAGITLGQLHAWWNNSQIQALPELPSPYIKASNGEPLIDFVTNMGNVGIENISTDLQVFLSAERCVFDGRDEPGVITEHIYNIFDWEEVEQDFIAYFTDTDVVPTQNALLQELKTLHDALHEQGCSHLRIIKS